MSIDEAIRILEPITSAEAIMKIEYYGGLSGDMAKIEAVNEACRLAVAALRAQQEAEKNKPLTLDELRKLDGEPVWCVDGSGCERWGLVNTENVLLEVIGSDSEALEGAFYNMTGDGKMGLHPLGWIAYRHKPKEGDDMSIRVGHPITRNYPKRYESFIRVREEEEVILYRRELHTQENNPVNYCSECGKRLFSRFTNYCPNCGAKMDLEETKNA